MHSTRRVCGAGRASMASYSQMVARCGLMWMKLRSTATTRPRAGHPGVRYVTVVNGSPFRGHQV
ncbi:MAG: hypothetical protein P8Z36_08035 [Gemmatimonadota bacterium]